MWIQCDGAHPHFRSEVIEYLNVDQQGRWIVQDRPLAWTAVMPDLTLLDFPLGLYEI